MPKHLLARRQLMLLFALTLLFLGGGAKSPSRAADAVDDRALQAKLGLFVECFNEFDSPLMAAYRDYRQTVRTLDADAGSGEILDFHGFGLGPTGGRSSDAEKCVAKLDASSSRPPRIDDLDRSAAEYAAASRRLMPLTPPVDSYYAQQDYKDDGFARGKALDGTIGPLLRQIATLSDEMRNAFQRETSGLRRRQLTEIEAREGRKILWHTRNFMIKARIAIEAVDDLVERRELDAETIERVLPPLQAAFDGASGYAAAHPDELKAKEPGAVVAWVLVEPQAALFLREMKDLRRDLSDSSLGDEKLVRRVNRDLNSVNVDFNNVVSAYNGSIR